MHRTHPLLLAALLAAAAAAQSGYVVSPRAYDTVEGPGGNTIPLWNGAYSYMQIHDDVSAIPIAIKELAFRKNGGTLQPIPAYSANVTVRLSTAATTSGTPSTTFAANHGPNLSEVITATNVFFPADPGSAAQPSAFLYVLPFPGKPFIYLPTGSLAWELRIHSITDTGVKSLDSTSYYIYAKYVGTGCLSAAQIGAPKPAPAYLSSSGKPNLSPPDTWAFGITVTNLAASQPYLWNIGYDDKRWGVLPLPFDLTPYGGKGCTIYVAPLISLGGMTDAKGGVDTTATPLVIPRDPAFAGWPLRFQALSLDPALSPLPLVFSNEGYYIIPPHHPLCRIYQSGSDTALSGTAETTMGLVTRFTY